MNKLEFNDKLADFLSGLKNYKQTDNKRALELYVGFLKETDGTKPMTKYLAENGKNPHGSLFGLESRANTFPHRGDSRAAGGQDEPGRESGMYVSYGVRPGRCERKAGRAYRQD